MIRGAITVIMTGCEFSNTWGSYWGVFGGWAEGGLMTLHSQGNSARLHQYSGEDELGQEIVRLLRGEPVEKVTSLGHSCRMVLV